MAISNKSQAAVDVEVAVVNDNMDVGVFGSSALLGFGCADNLLDDIVSILQGL